MSDFVNIGHLRVRPEAVMAYWRTTDHLNPHMPSTAVVIRGGTGPVFVDVPFARVDEMLDDTPAYARPENDITERRMRGEIA